jgi:hypothetical protein
MSLLQLVRPVLHLQVSDGTVWCPALNADVDVERCFACRFGAMERDGASTVVACRGLGIGTGDATHRFPR